MTAASAAMATMITLASIAAAPAAASPRTDPTSGRAVFTGAASVHPTSVRVNPSLLGVDAAVGVYVAYLASTMVVDSEQISRDTSAADFSGAAELSELRSSMGTELSISWHPTDRISVGMGLRTTPAETFTGSSGTLSYHAMGGQQRDMAATVAGALRVSSIFYVGAALSLARANLNLRFARDTALDDPAAMCSGAPCGLGNPEAAELYDIDVGPASLFSNQNVALTLGLVLKLGSDTIIGVAYHTPPGFAVQSQLSGKATVTLAPRNLPTPETNPVVKANAVVDVAYPASVEGGLRTPLVRDFQLLAGVRWEDTSRLSGYDVRPHGRPFTRNGVPEWIRRARGLGDAVAGWAGVEQIDQGEAWRFGGRLGFELSSTPDDRVSPSGNSTHSLTADLGAQWRLTSAKWSLQLSYGIAYFLPVSVDESAFSALHVSECAASGYDYASDACRAVRDGYGIEGAGGDYDRLQHAFRLGARYEF